MKKILFIILIASLIFSCSNPKYGSLKGNAYWKYNDYVGNKPDAGTEIFLFSDTGSRPLQQTCDVAGNFNFDKLPVGKYFVVAKSKATNCLLYNDINEISPYLGNGFIGFKPDDALLFTKFFKAYNKINQFELTGMGRSNKNFINYEDTLTRFIINADSFAIAIFESMSQHAAFKKWVFNFGLDSALVTDILPVLQQKIKMSNVIIEENKENSIVIDFGITYSK